MHPEQGDTASEPGADPSADPRVIHWSGLLLNSFRRWLGRELVERTGSPEADARILYYAPFVVVSHGTQADPILNYGNRTAQDLFEMNWAILTQMPSRLTAEPGNRQERARMLEEAQRQVWFEGYRGVRISRSGRRFQVENSIVWNVMEGDRRVGQAAALARWAAFEEEHGTLG